MESPSHSSEKHLVQDPDFSQTENPSSLSPSPLVEPREGIASLPTPEPFSDQGGTSPVAVVTDNVEEDAPLLPLSSLPSVSYVPLPQSLHAEDSREHLEESLVHVSALQVLDESDSPNRPSDDASTSGRSAADGARQEEEEEREAAIAQGLVSLMGPIVRDMDARMQRTSKSQQDLEAHVVRLMNELDKMLEDTPLPLVMQHAAKLVSVRKRVLSLTTALRTIQGRISNMNRLLSERSGSPKKSRGTPKKSWKTFALGTQSQQQPQVQLKALSASGLSIPPPPTLPFSRSTSPVTGHWQTNHPP